MSFKCFLNESKLFASTTSAGRQFRKAGAATENARLASSVRVLGTIRRGVLESLRVQVTRRGHSAVNSGTAARTSDEP